MTTIDSMTTIDRITSYVAGLGALLTAGAFMVSTSAGIGALAGAAVSIADFLIIRFVAARMMVAGEKARAILSLVLVGKMTLLLGVCAAILFYGRVNAFGFMVGIGAMVLGVLLGGIHEHLGAAPSPAVSSPTEGE
jgi:hypothetical protein